MDQPGVKYGTLNIEIFGQMGHGCLVLNPHISGTTGPISINWCRWKGNVTRIPNMSLLFRQRMLGVHLYFEIDIVDHVTLRSSDLILTHVSYLIHCSFYQRNCLINISTAIYYPSDMRDAYLRHAANARRAFLCTNCIGYPLNVWPSGTARRIACWNSSLPAVTPGTKIGRDV